MIKLGWRLNVFVAEEPPRELAYRAIRQFGNNDHPLVVRDRVKRLDLSCNRILATVNPIVLAQLEPVWDVGQDKLFNADYEEVPWERHGTAGRWLMSPAYRVRQGGAFLNRAVTPEGQTFRQVIDEIFGGDY